MQSFDLTLSALVKGTAPASSDFGCKPDSMGRRVISFLAMPTLVLLLDSILCLFFPTADLTEADSVRSGGERLHIVNALTNYRKLTDTDKDQRRFRFLGNCYAA